jgi:hypothetical protein
MLDILSKIVAAGVLDVDGTGAGAKVENSATFNLGRTGLPSQMSFVVHITDGTVAVIEPVTFSLQVSLDGGTDWRATAVIQAGVADNKLLLAVPVG